MFLGSNISLAQMALATAHGSSAWTPADITTALWLDADDATTITEVTGVSQWDDKSTVGTRDVVQVDTNKQPVYNSTAKTVTFDGSDDYLDVSFGETLTQPRCIFMVAKTTRGTPDDCFCDGISSTQRHAIFAQGGVFFGFSGAVLNGPSIDNVAHIFSVDYNGASGNVSIDGADGTDGAIGTQSLAGVRVGAPFAAAGQRLQGYIQEYVLTDAALSTDDRQKMQGYLAWKWDTINGDTALVTALPAGHPYKSAAPTA